MTVVDSQGRVCALSPSISILAWLSLPFFAFMCEIIEIVGDLHERREAMSPRIRSAADAVLMVPHTFGVLLFMRALLVAFRGRRSK